MKIVKRAVLLIMTAVLSILGMLGIYAGAATVTDSVSWTMPIQYADTAPLPLSDIGKSTVVWGTQSGGPYPNAVDIPAPATSIQLTRQDLGYGRRCYRVSVTTTAALGSVQSQWSTERCKNVQAPPNEPTGLTVQ
jgi:hypothetical protein